jgi:hypothetical protein
MSRTPEAKTRRNAKNHKIAKNRADYAVTAQAMFDTDASGYNVTTSGPVDRNDDTLFAPQIKAARELLQRDGKRRRLPETNVPGEDSFDGHYTTSAVSNYRDRKNYAAGSDHEGTTDWRKEILEDRADADVPLDKLIGR